MVGVTPWNTAEHWRWGPHWSGGWSHVTVLGDADHEEAGPVVTRDYVWSGGDRLEIDAPADVQYSQGPTSKITVTGPKDELDRLTIQHGKITYQGWAMDPRLIKIIMTAPDVTHFDADGPQTLSINGYDHDDLNIEIAGSGDVTAKGKARRVLLSITGAGDGDLGGVAGGAVKVEIDGSGDAVIAPKTAADVPHRRFRRRHPADSSRKPKHRHHRIGIDHPAGGQDSQT